MTKLTASRKETVQGTGRAICPSLTIAHAATQKPSTSKSAPKRRTREVAVPGIASKFALKRKFLRTTGCRSSLRRQVRLFSRRRCVSALPIPPGAIVLGDIKATADGAVALGSPAAKVTLKGGMWRRRSEWAFSSMEPTPSKRLRLHRSCRRARARRSRGNEYVAVRASYDLEERQTARSRWSRCIRIIWCRKLDEPPLCQSCTASTTANLQ